MRAAGGVVHRAGEVLLVHRPRYDDWTFPKGKLEEGESDEECALREVHEETGLRCVLDEELGTTEHVDDDGTPKQVRWWRMHPIADDGFRPNDEVDELRWLVPEAAADLLTYPADRTLLDPLSSAMRDARADERADR